MIKFRFQTSSLSVYTKSPGGEGGIRTLGTALQPYIGLANRRTRPLCDLSTSYFYRRYRSDLHQNYHASQSTPFPKMLISFVSKRLFESF